MWDVRYRPMRFTDVLGQDGAVRVLKARLEKNTALDTSYIFSGGHGQGKTTLARILGRALLCQNLTAEAEPCNECENCTDILTDSSVAFSEMDSASRGTIEHARAIVDSLAFVVPGAQKKVYVFDESHRMSRDAQDVLLKPVEDKKMVAIFCTTEPEKIRGPIRSRCEAHQIRKITRENVLQRMKWVLAQEKVEHEDDAVLILIDHSGGHVRDVLNKLEMIAQLGPVTVEAVRDHLNLTVVSTYYQILLSLSDAAVAVKLAEDACERVGPEEVAEGIAEAAMNSFRLAHGMFTEFSFVDRGLAEKVHGLYGDAVTKFSEYFLRSYRVTRIGLFSDILACRAGVPSTQAAAPVVVQVPVAVQPVQLVQPAQAPVVTHTVEPKPTPVVETSKSTPPPKNGGGAAGNRRSDGIGNLGSGDPAALTSEDTKGVPLEPSRGKDLPKPAMPQASREMFLTPEEWRRRFIQRCSIFAKGEV
jgi:DNA polymerase III subunit gamma/tau